MTPLVPPACSTIEPGTQNVKGFPPCSDIVTLGNAFTVVDTLLEGPSDAGQPFEANTSTVPVPTALAGTVIEAVP